MSRDRKSNFRDQKKNILIVCEGTTEEIYLKCLKREYRLTAVVVEVRNANGGSPLNVYETAKKIVDYNNKSKLTKVDKVFCVFDHDNKNLNTELYPALQNMLSDNYIPIYTNLSFELWLHLHHEDIGAKAFTNPSALFKALKKQDKKYHKTEYNVASYLAKKNTAIIKSQKLVDFHGFEYPSAIQHLTINPYTNMCFLLNELKKESS